MKKALDFVRTLRSEIVEGVSEDVLAYQHGYQDALNEVEEYILDAMWDAGEDDDEEA